MSQLLPNGPPALLRLTGPAPQTEDSIGSLASLILSLGKETGAVRIRQLKAREPSQNAFPLVFDYNTLLR